MRTPMILRAAMTTAFAGLLAVSGSSAASAEPQGDVQPYNFSPSQCFDKWNSDPNGYDGGGWEHNLVHRVFYEGPGKPPKGTIDITCGREDYGMIHIGHSESTSREGPHPVPPHAEDAFEQCLINIAWNYDNHEDQRNGYHKLSFGDSRTGAAVVYNPDNGRVKTMWANGNAQSNDWTRCAAR